MIRSNQVDNSMVFYFDNEVNHFVIFCSELLNANGILKAINSVRVLNVPSLFQHSKALPLAN
jgi:hypothetical protein